MSESKKLILVGDSAFAEIAYEYYTHDSDYEVVAFAVEVAFRKRDELFGLPVIDVEEMETEFAPCQHSVYVATVYTQLNRLRARLMGEAKAKGYALASYISSHAFIWPNVSIGEHCFIFENNTVQPFVRLEDNVVLWSGNHIGHHSTVKSHCFISSHVVLSGFCVVGESCFLGVNSTVANNITIGPDCWVGPGALIVKDTDAQSFYKAPPAEAARITTHRYFKIKE
jgi:sugar O-acyltransferase (sialic acid O-acetyltransferase NeuD family)